MTTVLAEVQESLVVASEPGELAEAQYKLIDSVEQKKLAAIREASELKEAAIAATESRLSAVSVKRAHKAATSRVTYLTKMEQILRAGFVMMPDMPGDVIAVRVSRKEPRVEARRISTGDWPQGVPDEVSDSLPPGEGRYISPQQTVQRVSRGFFKKSYGEGTEEKFGYRAVALRDPFGLDKLFVKPIVIKRTAAAMATKLFDEIVTIRPQNTRNRKSKDPIVLGRIVDKVTKTTTAFMIAWFVDATEL